MMASNINKKSPAIIIFDMKRMVKTDKNANKLNFTFYVPLQRY